jgi:hypothetical protein
MEYRDRYWMVHNRNNLTPTVQHADKYSAQEEAKRLAAKHVGETFFILEAASAFCVIMPEPIECFIQARALPTPAPAPVECPETEDDRPIF